MFFNTAVVVIYVLIISVMQSSLLVLTVWAKRPSPARALGSLGTPKQGACPTLLQAQMHTPLDRAAIVTLVKGHSKQMKHKPRRLLVKAVTLVQLVQLQMTSCCCKMHTASHAPNLSRWS
jgi:hypothetical protein